MCADISHCLQSTLSQFHRHRTVCGSSSSGWPFPGRSSHLHANIDAVPCIAPSANANTLVGMFDGACEHSERSNPAASHQRNVSLLFKPLSTFPDFSFLSLLYRNSLTMKDTCPLVNPLYVHRRPRSASVKVFRPMADPSSDSLLIICILFCITFVEADLGPGFER